MMLATCVFYRVTPYQLQLFLESVEEVLKLLYQSIHLAFTSAGHRSNVEHVLGLMFDMVLSDCFSSPSSPLLGLPALPKLTLPADIAVSQKPWLPVL